MGFPVIRDGDRIEVRVPTQLVVGNRQELKQCVVEQLAHGARRFRIDFRQTGYVDSAGLGALVSASKKIREHAGELRLANLNDDLKTLLELTKLDLLFAIDNDDDGLAGCLAPLRPPPPKPIERKAASDWPDANATP